MAVRIDIPGIGVVEAENAASEDTLRALLAAVNAANGTSGGPSKKQKADDDAAKAAQGLSGALGKAGQGADQFKMGWAGAADAAVKSLKTIGLTAVALATKFATDYANIAENPIKETAGVLNTLIDTTAAVTTSFTDCIPVVGGFISALVNASAELAKAANTTFANQMQKNVEALQSYAKSGVSFAGSMDEMNLVAHEAGLGISDFTKIVAQNKEELNKLGMAGGDAAARLSGAMGKSATVVGKSGQSLRDEMFKMGYTFEEQGAVMTSFMANMQASGKLRSMSDKEIAEGTRAYAKDLKVIADITGQDAKKLMERARAESMRGALMSKLQGNQKDAFMKANAVMAKAGPEVQAALTQYLTFGKITDPKIAANKAMVDMVTGVGEQIKAGNQNMADVTQQEMSKAYKTMTESGSGFAQATDRALVAGSGGLSNQIAEVSNRFMAAMGGMPDEKAAEKSGNAAEDMANTQGALAASTAELYSSTKKYQVEMESLVNDHMPKFIDLLKKTNEETQGRTMKAIRAATSTAESIASEDERNKEAATFGEKLFSTHYLDRALEGTMKLGGAILPDFLGGGLLTTLGENAQAERVQSETEYLKKQGRFARGGSIAPGKVGIVGEAGPELISGPTDILSREATANMEKFFKGGTGAESTAKATKEAADRTASLMESTNQHLQQLVGLMEKTVNNTARVALNTN